MYKNKEKLNFFNWFYERILFYAKARKFPPWPWRYLWIAVFLKSLLYKPIMAIKYFRKLSRREIPVDGYILLVWGPKLLRDGLKICRELNLKPFLIYGTLLGFIREQGFIKHDFDIDLGLLKDDFIKKSNLKQALIAKGYKFRLEDEFEISFCHPRFSSLLLDFFLVYNKNGQMATSMVDRKRNRVYSYYFPSEIFKDFKLVAFEKSEVLIPSQAEKFLLATYGDWKIPKKVFDENTDSINLKIEEKTV